MAFLLRKYEVEDLRIQGCFSVALVLPFPPILWSVSTLVFLIHKARNTVFTKLKTLRVELTNIYQTHKQFSYQMMCEQVVCVSVHLYTQSKTGSHSLEGFFLFVLFELSFLCELSRICFVSVFRDSLQT